MELQVLRVYHYNEECESENKRITLSPAAITLVAASTEDMNIQGKRLVKTSVLLADGGSIDLNIDHADLELLEKVVGGYSLEHHM